MSSPYTCEACGERCDGHTDHRCPGTPSDRLVSLEDDVAGIYERFDSLEDDVAGINIHLILIKERLAKLEKKT